MSHKESLKQLLLQKSLFRGNFTLSSGKQSNYYLDCKLTTLDADGAALTAYTILELLEDRGISADAVGGPELGAVPIVAAVAAVSSIRANSEKKGKPLPSFLVRKEAKGHGRQRQIEGIEIGKVQRVAIVDEVCTTAGSVEIALAAVKREGLEITAVIILVDRQEGGHEKLRSEYGDRYIPIFTAEELLKAAGQAKVEPSRVA